MSEVTFSKEIICVKDLVIDKVVMDKIKLIICLFLISSCSMSEETPLCDWMKKPHFGKCLKDNFLGKDVGVVEEFLESNEFLTTDNQNGSSIKYYQRTSNSNSGYKVAVIIEAASDGTLKSIKIR